MQLESVFQSQLGSAADASKGLDNQSGKDQFLKLLIAQMSNQDPMSPMDDSQMITQLAQFTHVEESLKTNQQLAQITQLLEQDAHLAGSNLIGKEIVAHGNLMHIDPTGKSGNIGYKLDRNVQDLQVSITNASGHVVLSKNLGPQARGSYEFVWDGRNQQGKPQFTGDYRVHFSAIDTAKQPMVVQTEMHGVVTGVDMSTPNAMRLNVGDQSVLMQDITQIGQP